MRRVILLLSVASLCSGSLGAQPTAAAPQAAPQTARQALMEMFFSKTPGTFAKHLPKATLTALEKSGALASLQMYSAMANQLQTQGQNMQTFETGSVLLSAEDPKTGQKVEITWRMTRCEETRTTLSCRFRFTRMGRRSGPRSCRRLLFR